MQSCNGPLVRAKSPTNGVNYGAVHKLRHAEGGGGGGGGISQCDDVYIKHSDVIYERPLRPLLATTENEAFCAKAV